MGGELDFSTFLTKAGAVDLLVLLDDEEGMIVEEIQNEIDAARQTVSNRVEEAFGFDLIKLVRKYDDHGNADRYILTERGKVVQNRILRQNVFEKLKEKREVNKEYERKLDELSDWVRNDPLLTAEDFLADIGPGEDY